MPKISLMAVLLAAACGGSDNQYVASMTAANETPANSSTATGTATYTVNGTTVNYTISYSNLTGNPTGAHIHVGAAGTPGPIVVPYPAASLPANTSGSWSGSFTAADVAAGTSGSTTIRAGNLDDVIAAFKAGTTYTNIHTNANKGGEIRGQIQPK